MHTTFPQDSTPAAGRPLSTIDDVRDRLRISRASVYALVNKGELTPLRVMGRLRFTEDDLCAFIERSRSPTSSAMNEQEGG